MIDIPTITTDRLTLRAYRRDDFAAYAAFCASPERTQFMGGPRNEDDAWTWFTNDISGWLLLGIGNFAIERDGVLIGTVGIVQPPDFPEPECGWMLFDGQDGAGYATEAAGAVLDHAFATTPLETVVSYIDKRHERSAAVARRLGAVLDPNAPAPSDGCDVYRHTEHQRRAA